MPQATINPGERKLCDVPHEACPRIVQRFESRYSNPDGVVAKLGPASISPARLEALVVRQLVRTSKRPRPSRKSADLVLKEQAPERADAALEAYRDGRVIDALTVDAYSAGLRRRQDDVSKARLALAAAVQRHAERPAGDGRDWETLSRDEQRAVAARP